MHSHAKARERLQNSGDKKTERKTLSINFSNKIIIIYIQKHYIQRPKNSGEKIMVIAYKNNDVNVSFNVLILIP